MNPKYGAGLLIAAYFVFGMAWNPMETLPNFQNVRFSECHWGCVPGSDPCVPLWICSSTSKKAAPTSIPGTGGSTGPTKGTHPIVGVSPPATTGVNKGPLGGSTSPTVPPKPTQGNINR